jgi:hypothetical protein
MLLPSPTPGHQRTRRALCAALLAGARPAPASAAEITRLGVASAMGDVLTVVVHRAEVGSRVDQNLYQAAPNPDTAFDDTARQVATDGARSALPQATAVQAADLAGASSALAKGWTEGARFAPPAALQAQWQAAGLSHLLLITRWRGATALKTLNTRVGSGHLEGLGFYVDKQQKMRRHDTGETGEGFLAPFAYLQLQLINLATGEVEKTEQITSTSTLSAARNPSGTDAWSALDPAQKVRVLQQLVRSGVGQAVPRLLGSGG